MGPQAFYNLLLEKLNFEPTLKQNIVLEQLSEFVLNTINNDLYLLKGYAGTGKTTIISSLVTNLWKIKKSAVLLAPTGRAAKVISNYSGQEAFTIHKKIYYPKKDKSGQIQFVLQPNKNKNTFFIVDEASMIPDLPSNSKLFENGSLLDDLMHYVYSGFKCKIIMVGDTAQLPPVKSELSPALDQNVLSLNYNKEVQTTEMDEVVRQAQDSGILDNATSIRTYIRQDIFNQFTFNLKGFKDIIRLIEGNEILNTISDSYSNEGKEHTAIIVRSNKRANLYNQQIRSRILFHENELCTGDYLMVVKNNYFWVKPTSEAGFIANGDIIEVLEIFKILDLYSFRFAEVKIRMVDYPKMKPFETILLLDTISKETPSLTYEESNTLYQNVLKDYENQSSSYKKFISVKRNKYFNALQVKFSYAMTCHKSQGGQWNNVFIEQPYLPNGITKEFLRWLYTAITRAKNKLYLIGFKSEFFEH